MPLPLTDPRWRELQSSYNGTDDVVTWLTEAYEQGGLSTKRLGDLINEVQHQGDFSTAMYAVATHLIELARRASPEEALTLLTHAGLIYANSDGPGAVPCPAFLREDFTASASEGAKMLSPLSSARHGLQCLQVGSRRTCRFHRPSQLCAIPGWLGTLRGTVLPRLA